MHISLEIKLLEYVAGFPNPKTNESPSLTFKSFSSFEYNALKSLLRVAGAVVVILSESFKFVKNLILLWQLPVKSLNLAKK